jgi:trigger factor
VVDEEVERAVKDMQKRLGKEEAVEESTDADKLAGTLYEVDADGARIEGGYSHEASFEISELKSKAEKNKLVGLHKGDKVVFNPGKAFGDEAKVTDLLHLGDGDEKLKASFELEVSDITKLEEAELNEDMFKQIYPSDELKTEEDFRERIRKELSEHYQKDADKQFVSDTIDIILEQVNPELPDEFLKRWLLDSNQGKVTKEQLDEQYDNYAKTFKWQLIENKLVEAYGEALRVEKEDVRNKVRAYFQVPEGAEPNPQIDGIVDQILSNDQEYQRIYGELMDEHYIAFFKEKIGKDEKDVTTEEFIKIISTPKN